MSKSLSNKFGRALLLGLLLAVSAPLLAQDEGDHKSLMIADWTRARDYTNEYLDAMPADQLGLKPTPEIRSFAEQMLHLASGNFGFSSAVIGQEAPYSREVLGNTETFSTAEEIKTVVTESYDYVIAAIEGMNDAALMAEVELFGQFNMPAVIALAKAFEHQTHHRGQTTIYLRLAGVTPPGEKLF